MTSRLMLICHASTDAVHKSAFPVDEPLDDLGKISAQALAPHLPSAARSWMSPELRTRQTADALQLNAIALSTLRDCDYGTWRGSSFNEVLARNPDAVSLWLRDPAATPHGGESLLSLMQRVTEWLEAENAMNRQTIVVTHPAIIRAAIVHAIDATPKSFWRIDIAPLSVTRLSGIKGRWNLTSAGCMTSSMSKDRSDLPSPIGT
jgi:broad specificity phosphatase PhoE